MSGTADYPDQVPATMAELRDLLREHHRVRCDGLLQELFTAPVLIGQLVMVSGEIYRLGGITGTPVRWLDHRPYSPATAEAHPYH